jgi:glutaredoxin
MSEPHIFFRLRSGGVLGVVLGIVGVAAFLVILFFLARATVGSGGGITFFYGEGCPHCAIVEKFFEENKVEQKVTFEKKEVYSNKKNQREMAAHAKTCGLPTDNIGIPFLWTGSKCLVGDTEIIAFFQSALTQLSNSSKSSRQ